MRKVVNLLVLGIAILSLASCGVHRHGRPPSKYDNQAVARLSKQFGLRLTQADNLSLYDACSGWLGVKYRNGGNTKKGVDCSGFVGIIYRQVYAITLERNSANILQKNCSRVSRINLREGDLVFFRTSGSSTSQIPTHVGIYLKNGKFVHASTSKGVMVSSLTEPYYVRTWITGGKTKRK
jgi:lipoprotein Spr